MSEDTPQSNASTASATSVDAAASPPPTSAPATPAAASATTPAKARNPWLWIAAAALALSGWQWLETRARLGDAQQEMARRLADSDTAGKESRLLAKQAQDQIAALHAKIGALEGKLADSQSQQASLENLYQDLARNRDEWALSEIEQGVTLAAQQLQLAGNVQGAILALQAADARLSGSARPQFISLRKALARDLDRLKAVPQVDIPSMSLRLENVIASVDTLALAVDARPRAETREGRQDARQAVGNETAPLAEAGVWQRLSAEIWQELRGLVRIQRFDRDEPVLLAPGQVFFLRENIKLRLLNARLALLSRDQWTFRNELKAAQALMERYFDAQNKSVQTAVGSLKQLGGAEVAIELPSLNESLSAIRSFRLARDRDGRDVRK